MNDDPNDDAIDPLVGQTIQDRFFIEKKIGQGGMGAVYLAEHLRLKKKVALKCLHPGLASNPEVVRRFKNEAVASSSIGHPHIVDVMDMGTFQDGTFFMVLEFLSGRDWQKDLDEQGAQTLAQVAHIGVQICAALSAASAKGIVHRDLKPENIFLVRRPGDENFVKILDFGISKILDGSGGATKTGQLMGTPYYMAPEQVFGEKSITHLADVYALGVIFFQALSGRVPFEGDTIAQVILKIASEAAPSLDQRVEDLPEAIVHLVSAMLAKDPQERPQTFQEVASVLAPFLPASSALASRMPGFAAAQSSGALSATTLAARGVTRAIALNASPLSRWKLGAGAVAALVLVTLSFLWGADDREEKVPADEPVVAVSAAVRVQISTVPADAELTLDGASIPNPFDRQLDKDAANHTLVVKRKGYETETRKMVFTAAQNLIIPLSEAPVVVEKPPSQASEKSSQSPASNSSGSSKAPKPIRDLERGIRKLF